MRLLITLTVTIFVTEALIMFGLRFVRIDNLGVDACIDAFTLTALLFPVLYFGVFKAITTRNVALATSERNLLVALAQLISAPSGAGADVAVELPAPAPPVYRRRFSLGRGKVAP